MRKPILRLTVTAALAAAAPATLPAAAVGGQAHTTSTQVLFNAAPGEVNQVTVRRSSRKYVRIRDAGAPITAGSGCDQVSARVVRCEATTAPRAPGGIVTLGDGNDSGRLLGGRTNFTLRGADGDDLLGLGRKARGQVIGDPGNDLLSGSDHANFLDGRDGNDTLVGNGGDDRLAGGPGTDVYQGGSGVDVVDYDDYQAPPSPNRNSRVRASFDGIANDGRGAENESLGGDVEGVRGGTRIDELRGDDRDNVFVLGTHGPPDVPGGNVSGRGGQDRITGGIGFELLQGGGGNDLIFDGDLNGQRSELTGGDGDDRIAIHDVAVDNRGTRALELAPTADEVRCGDGQDQLIVDMADPRPLDCEIVTFQEPGRATTAGTANNDRIVGQRGPGGSDVIDGAGGDDLIFGRGRADRLIGGRGSDFLIGGRGGDSLHARDGDPDTVRCGKGRDRAFVDRSDLVARNCERVRRA